MPSFNPRPLGYSGKQTNHYTTEATPKAGTKVSQLSVNIYNLLLQFFLGLQLNLRNSWTWPSQNLCTLAHHMIC
jgi:hypothetical protein